MFAKHQDTMRRLVDLVINNKRLELIDELVHPDYVFRAPGEELRGREALKGFFLAYQTALPDLRVTINELIDAGNKTVLLFRLSGTQQNDLMGIPATGRRVNVNGIVCSRFVDGQIIEEWELLDQLNLLRQLGVVEA